MLLFFYSCLISKKVLLLLVCGFFDWEKKLVFLDRAAKWFYSITIDLIQGLLSEVK